jgi:hypothetical protein
VLLRTLTGRPAAGISDDLANTTRLCEANIAALFLYDGEVLSTAASYGTTQECGTS